MKVENEYSKVKVNNEIDLCSVTDLNIKSILEKALMKARVSYFLRWDKPNFFAKVFGGAKTEIVFCINSAQVELADEVLEQLKEYEADIKIIRVKSNNNIGF